MFDSNMIGIYEINFFGEENEREGPQYGIIVSLASHALPKSQKK